MNDRLLWRMVDRVEIEQTATAAGWPFDAYLRFKAMLDMSSPGFPCIFGLRGWKRNQLRFVFGNETDSDGTRLGAVLRQYLLGARCLGEYTSLVVIYAPEQEIRTPKEYAAQFWDILQRLHNLDEKPWPDHIPQDIADPHWDFCFHGEPLFVPANLPCYERRRSRGNYSFGMMFQPRWVFDSLISNPDRLARARSTIRARARLYDDVSVHPAIGVYGDQQNVEWRQYVLPDDNDTVLNRCPLHISGAATGDGHEPLAFIPIVETKKTQGRLFKERPSASRYTSSVDSEVASVPEQQR